MLEKSSEKFNQVVYDHLSKMKISDKLVYKKKHIEYKLEQGTFRNNKYDHIFCDELCQTKIGGDYYCEYSYLPPFRNEIINYLKENKNRIKLHKGQKHLNSSQGLVINFLVPIIVLDLQEEFTKFVFDHKGIITIEHTMKDDGGTKRGTEVDFSILGKDNTLHIYEAKFTESNFGKVSIDNENLNYDIQKYRAKWFGTSYPENNPTINASSDKVIYSFVTLLFKNKNIVCDRYNENNILERSNKFTYFDNYQLVRNLYNTYFELKNGDIKKRDNIGSMNVLISMYNKTQKNEFNRFKKQLNNIVNVNLNFWETICDKAIEFSKDIPKLFEHYKLFKEVFLGFSDISSNDMNSNKS